MIFIPVVAQGLKSRVSGSKCCLNTEIILLECKAEKDNITILQDTKKWYMKRLKN